MIHLPTTARFSKGRTAINTRCFSLLSFYQRLFAQGMKYLKDGGFMAVEIGIYQAEPVKQMAIDNGWQNIEIIKDYAGIDRVVLAWKQN